MRVLIIKTSSMGDVIHTLPALTDAGNNIADIQFDWVVEENFSEIPHWHPLVKNIIPIALRRWRKKLFAKQTWSEWKNASAQLRATQYDIIIDAQGLLKSAWLVFAAKGKRSGFNWKSARESLASLFYQRRSFAGKIAEVHAVTRIRTLFADVLGYAMPHTVADYGIDRQKLILSANQEKNNYVVFLHGTTWTTKHWPETYWLALPKKSR